MEDYVTQFIQSIIPDVEVEFEDDEFCVNIEERVINIGINPDPEGDRLIQEFVFNKFGVPMDSFLIGVLHEVFHIITYDKEAMEEDRVLYALLTMNYDEMSLEEYSQIYFNLPTEFKATEGAVKYYLENQEKCDAFMDMIR